MEDTHTDHAGMQPGLGVKYWSDVPHNAIGTQTDKRERERERNKLLARRKSPNISTAISSVRLLCIDET